VKTVTRSITALTTIAFVLILFGCQSKPTANPADLFTKAQDLQKQEKFQEAIQVYRQIAHDFPKSREGANSQFMIGFIYGNHLQDYAQAKVELSAFLDKFAAVADSGLVEGAKFELKYMGKPIEDIPTLATLNDSSTAPGMDTTAH